MTETLPPRRPTLLARWRSVALWKRVLAGLVLGALTGLAVRWIAGPEASAEAAAVWFKPLGDTFVQLIRMLVVPLVFTTLVAGVIAMGEPAKLGSIGLKAIGLYMLTTLFAVCIGLVLGAILQPGAGVDFGGVTPGPVATEAPSVAERLIAIIPANPFGALASGDILAIIFFAILTGVAILMLREVGKPMASLFDSASAVMLKITDWVMELAPFGVFFLIAWVTADRGLSTFTSVALLALCVYAGCILHMLLVYGGLLRILLRLPALPFFRGAFDAQAVAYSTSSSSATLPVTISCARENLGVDKAVASSVIPLGATINMDGTALYLGILALFAAQAFGLDLGFADYLLIALTATLTSIGAAGIPSASLFLLATVLTAIGATPEQTALMVGFILPFDRPLDMMRTLTNVTGDMAVSVAVAKSEGTLDVEAYRRTPVV
jgi:Na+/H+-dicarboxylate symporter